MARSRRAEWALNVDCISELAFDQASPMLQEFDCALIIFKTRALFLQHHSMSC